MQKGPVALTALSLEPPRPYVAPKIKRQDVGAWLVGGKGFFDNNDQFWPAGSRLYFDGEPNMDLIPLNELAFKKKEAFLDKLDKYGAEKAKKDNRDYIPLPRTKWNPDEVPEDLPMPESVLGMKRKESNDAIR